MFIVLLVDDNLTNGLQVFIKSIYLEVRIFIRNTLGKNKIHVATVMMIHVDFGVHVFCL